MIDKYRVPGFYNVILNKVPEGILIYNEDGVKFANKRLSKMIGYSKKELSMLDPFDLLPANERERIKGFAEKIYKGEESKTHHRVRFAREDREDKKERTFEVWGSKILFEKSPSILVFVREVSLEETLNRGKKELELLSSAIADNANEGIYIREFSSGKIIYANKKFAEIHDKPLKRIIGMNSHDLLCKEDRKKVEEMLSHEIPQKVELQVKSENGIRTVEETSGLIKERGKPKYLFGIMRDITETEKYEKDLEEIAVKDALTGLYNRHFFNEFINKEWERCKRYNTLISLIFMDIDNFKMINDKFGHLTGDMVLKDFGKILLNSIRKSDYAVRFGGDEFLVTLTHTNDEVNFVKGRIIEETKKWSKENVNKGLELSVSFGYGAFYPAAGNKVEEVLKKLDEMMYKEKSKRIGK